MLYAHLDSLHKLINILMPTLSRGLMHKLRLILTGTRNHTHIHFTAISQTNVETHHRTHIYISAILID